MAQRLGARPKCCLIAAAAECRYHAPGMLIRSRSSQLGRPTHRPLEATQHENRFLCSVGPNPQIGGMTRSLEVQSSSKCSTTVDYRKPIMRRALFILIFLVLTAPVTYVALSRMQIWLHGYGFACIPEVVRDVPSPSGKWVARVRHLDCDALAKDYLTEVVLIRGDAFISALSKDYVVLSRDANYPDHVPMSLMWESDEMLRIETPDCPSRECGTPDKAPDVSVSVGT